MKCRLLKAMRCKKTEARPDGRVPAGTVIDHPDAYLLVRLGCAESVDAECAEKAARSPQQLAQARKAQERTSRGIHPDDFEAYDRGEMIGYEADGSPIPGPNFVPPDEELVDEEDEEEAVA